MTLIEGALQVESGSGAHVCEALWCEGHRGEAHHNKALAGSVHESGTHPPTEWNTHPPTQCNTPTHRCGTHPPTEWNTPTHRCGTCLPCLRADNMHQCGRVDLPRDVWNPP
eukprot:365369-Chlamydomonas_euryale.AAC.8